MAVLKCKKCKKEVSAKDLSFITLPYVKATINMVGMCKECYKELERWLNNEELERQINEP